MWNAEIRAPNSGGIIDPERAITAMFSAPPEGYEVALKIGSNANPGRWDGGGVRTFYLKTGSGNYVKVWADFHPSAQDTTGFVTLRWWFNPKVGSRVLEPKQTEQALNH